MATPTLDSVRLAVADLDLAVAAYTTLLGREPSTVDPVPRFELERGGVELIPGPPGLNAIRFTTGTEQLAREHDAFGIRLRITPAAAARAAVVAGPVEAIDHVVIHTVAPERAIGYWRDQFGLRLALDRVFSERGLRLIFFRSGDITLEYAHLLAPSPSSEEPDRFYGLSYRVRDLEAHCARLAAAGVDVSPIRSGMRPGTMVASVRSATAGVPTLLLAAG